MSQSGGRQAAQPAKRRKLANIDSDDEIEYEVIDLSSQPSPIPVRPHHLPFRCRQLTVAGALLTFEDLCLDAGLSMVWETQKFLFLLTALSKTRPLQPPDMAHTARVAVRAVIYQRQIHCRNQYPLPVQASQSARSRRNASGVKPSLKEISSENESEDDAIEEDNSDEDFLA